MNPQTSPFKFLDSYQKNDRDVFFGRDKDINDLYSALSGVKNLLLYGPSGSGKTSLIECGLRNQFSDADWFALTIRRRSNINASFFTVINGALTEKIAMDPDTKLPKDDQVNFGQALEELFTERYQPVYLLFDQFEELLILGDDGEKKEFFTRLNQLIRYKVPCRVIMIMREEFIGYLSEFEPLCSSLFQHRFRLEKMGRLNVHEVIFNILTAPRYRVFFEVEQTDALCKAILSKLPDIKHEIELAHVQVFLGELWERAYKRKLGDAKPILQPDLIEEKDNLESVLDVFLKKQFTELEPIYGEKAPLELLAAMITERNTKLQLGEAELQRDLDSKSVLLRKPLNALLKELELRRIIRTIKSGDATKYEISHDILALLVGQNRTQDMKERERAREIYAVYEERTGFLSQEDLNLLRPYEKYHPPSIINRIKESEANIEAIQKKEMADANRKIRLRIVGGFLILAMMALVAAVYFAVDANHQRMISNNQRSIAVAQKLLADQSRFTADSARTEAEARLKLIQNVQDSLNALIASLPIANSATINKLGLIQQHLQKGTDFNSLMAAKWGILLHTEFRNRLNGFNNQFLGPNEAICSKNGYYFLIYQADGNLVLYERLKEGRAERWSTKTSGKPAYQAKMEDDGNFVIYGNKDFKTSRIWASETRGGPKSYLQLEDKGNLVIYNNATLIWQRNP